MKTGMTLEQATKGLTVHEVRIIQRHYEAPLERLSGTEITAATTWAYMVRDGVKPGDAWKQVDGMSLDDLGNAFEDESPVLMEGDPQHSKSGTDEA